MEVKSENVLIFKDEDNGDQIIMYYDIWLTVIREILMKYADKTYAESLKILNKHYYKKPVGYFECIYLSHELEYHWAMIGAYGEQYWLNDNCSELVPDDYYEWYKKFLDENNFTEPFEFYE